MRAPRSIALALLVPLGASLLTACDPEESGTRCAPSRVANGRVVLHRCPVPDQTLAHECGPGCRQLTRVGNAPDTLSRYCVTSRSVYWASGGYLLRAELQTGRAESLLGPWGSGPPVSATGVSCDGDVVAFTATQRPPQRVDLVARFRDGDPVAAIAWSDVPPRRETPPPEAPALSASWLAWTGWFSGPGVWAREPGSTLPRAVRSGVRPAGPSVASGEELFYQAGIRIERLRLGASGPEALAPGPGDQWDPAVGYGHVAWIDQRDELSGSHDNPRNPQVYVFDLATGAFTRVSRGGAAYRSSPSLSPDWVVWVDTRRDPDPDRGRGAAYTRAEVWGFDLRNGSEAVLAEDVIAYAPRVSGARLFYVSPSDGTRLDFFVQTLTR